MWVYLAIPDDKMGENKYEMILSSWLFNKRACIWSFKITR